jgi:hypothetical protein
MASIRAVEWANFLSTLSFEACMCCDDPDAWKARKEIFDIVMALRRGEMPPEPPPGLDDCCPINCCRRG